MKKSILLAASFLGAVSYTNIVSAQDEPPPPPPLIDFFSPEEKTNLDKIESTLATLKQQQQAYDQLLTAFNTALVAYNKKYGLYETEPKGKLKKIIPPEQLSERQQVEDLRKSMMSAAEGVGQSLRNIIFFAQKQQKLIEEGKPEVSDTVKRFIRKRTEADYAEGLLDELHKKLQGRAIKAPE